jgi:hypothetical protein
MYVHLKNVTRSLKLLDKPSILTLLARWSFRQAILDAVRESRGKHLCLDLLSLMHLYVLRPDFFATVAEEVTTETISRSKPAVSGSMEAAWRRNVEWDSTLLGSARAVVSAASPAMMVFAACAVFQQSVWQPRRKLKDVDE